MVSIGAQTTEFAETELLRWIPLLPLMGAVVSGTVLSLVRRPFSRGLVISISCLSVLGSFILTLVSFFRLIGLEHGQGMLVDSLYTWLGVGVGSVVFSADLAFQLDSLSAVMCLVVTGVGLLIHIYSVGYMDTDHRDDGGFQRFFCYLNLFLCSMLVLVLGDNVLLMFMGWEGVGLCSYLLIGFWYGDNYNAYAGSKAFIVNRIGDFGFLVGFLLLFWSLADAGAPAVAFRDIQASIGHIAAQSVMLPAWLGGAEIGLATLICLCLMLGAFGKSAQIPLYVWLPDAMAGPTPVSALIHAATMVTAGVYMVCRFSFLFELAPGALAVLTWVGGLTALLSATIAMAQMDIKKVLAYSTVSQLGYMFMAAGCGAYGYAMFHVVTHAFFKALLFMSAGAVIVSLHHEQDMRNMGGLRRKLPRTHLVMLAGVAAIAGFPLTSGFLSKDQILTSLYLAHDLPGHGILYGIALFTAGLTAFYMCRMLFMTFYGDSRASQEVYSHAHDPSNWIMWPLYVLAALSIFGGVFGVPQFWGDMLGIEHSDSLGNFLSASVVTAPHHEISHATEWRLIGAAVSMAGSGFALAYLLYMARPELPDRIAKALGSLHEAAVNKFYVDEFYDAVIVRPLVVVSDKLLFRGIDAGLIDGAFVNGTASTVRAVAAGGLKYLQSGFTQFYFLTMVAGALAILVYLLG